MSLLYRSCKLRQSEAFLKGFISLPNDDYSNLKEILLVDEAQHHFILFTHGWKEDSYVHFTSFHLEVKSYETI